MKEFSFKAIYLGVAQIGIRFSRSLVLIQRCNGHAIRANVNKPSDECLPRERLVQGKRHVGKKALLAGYLIPLLRSQKPCNKETQFPKVLGRRI